MGKKFYAVKKGTVPGIYNTWAECQNVISGFPKAEFKGFSTKIEAEEYLEGNNSSVAVLTVDIDSVIAEQNDETLIVFTDGTYNNEANLYGYGIVLLDNKKNILGEYYGSDSNSNYIESRNVAGEIDGVKNAIIKAVTMGYKNISIFYDYEGIEKWVAKEWKANKLVSRDYVSFVEEMKKCINITYYKVPAHSGVEFNERADSLAKKSILAKGFKQNSDGSITVLGITQEEWNIIFDLLRDEKSGTIKIKNTGDFTNGKHYIITEGQENIHISCYQTGKTSIQGKQSALFALFMSMVVELVPDDTKVMEVLNAQYDISIPDYEVEEKFMQLLPNFDSKKTSDKKLIKTLKAAVFNTILSVNMPDYSHLATPSLRATEYFLQYIFINKDIMSITGKNTSFGYFDENNKIFALQDAHHDKFTAEQIIYVNKLYNFYYGKRHSLFHWSKTGQTDMISTMDKARIVICDNLKLIDEYYKYF